MKNMPKYFLVDANMLPEVFIRVAEAKRALETGKCKTVNDAANYAGISRSAFYKYKDAVKPFVEMSAGHIVTFQMTLRDEPGALSNLLNIFASAGTNILTINQSIPTNGCAPVTISAETSESGQLDELMKKIAEDPNVIKFEISAA